jgi:putative ABC transport system permease protein
MQAAAETNFGVQAQMFFGFDSEDKEYGKRDNTARMITLLLSLALAFMALPAINLVNVNVSRILERASEIGVRKAFGASGTALVGQFIVENLVLTVIGGAIGVLLAEAVLLWITSAGLFPNAVFHVNARVALYALGMSVVFGLLSGVLPAWKMARLPIVQSLKGGINA